MAANGASCLHTYRGLMLGSLPFNPHRLTCRRLPLLKKTSTSTCKQDHVITQAIDEETIPNYRRTDYYSNHPGKVLHNKYETITKLGWGFGSTVWLAEDLRRPEDQTDAPRYVAIKIGTRTYGSTSAAEHELKLSQWIATANPSHPGAGYIRTPIDNFKIDGSHGPHICLVYRPMRETMLDFQNRFRNQRFPPKILRLYIALLLQGLNYLHSECHLIHTDLKSDNVLVDLENESVLEDFVQQQKQSYLPRHVTDDGHSTYLSQSDFGPLRDYFILPEIADLDLAQFGEGLARIHPVQPHRYRAPEVILGTTWSYSADIWNLGVLIWNMMEGKDLFTNLKNEEGNYNAHAHLGQMIALLGPPPTVLLKRENASRKLTFEPEIQNPEGQSCKNAFEYFVDLSLMTMQVVWVALKCSDFADS
ncbi:Protein kinase-like (PK-like) [Glarea lozoyensis ATCC 20868]|uniref:non-specific serine/threonine protein kinase n=1 Tax=Glarea lozoyensis (strain ATCC 20868 / MF5171) TaxID=1116229 RepID=S3CIG0_GLAL2|nr:Protein kinase-like (PK-like) [Glarea lozoyensis ATCC 20868]EPE26262.1 Protein kinase-like (PK-like) [Glarea lozoyensis ATCC 20868]